MLFIPGFDLCAVNQFLTDWVLDFSSPCCVCYMNSSTSSTGYCSLTQDFFLLMNLRWSYDGDQHRDVTARELDGKSTERMRTRTRGQGLSSFLSHSLLQRRNAPYNLGNDRPPGPHTIAHTISSYPTTWSIFSDVGPGELASSAGDWVSSVKVDAMIHQMYFRLFRQI
jgi:hypothetical protein